MNREQYLSSLVNEKSGDYYYEPTGEYLCVAIVDGNPRVIGGYKPESDIFQRMASQRIWQNYMRNNGGLERE